MPVKPQVANPNRIRFESLRFMDNTSNLCSDIENSEESDLHVDFKRNVKNSEKNSKYISKRRPLVVDNPNTENQTTFSKVPIFPGDKSYSDAVTKETEQKTY